jgi:hypothetical protein
MSYPDLPKAFDVSLYTKLSESNLVTHIAFDLKSLAIETSTNHARVTTFSYLVDNDRVVCPEFDPRHDISELLTWNTPLDSQTSQAALAIRNLILHTDSPSFIIWASPPDPSSGLPETRLTLHYVHPDVSGRTVSENYGLAAKLDSSACIDLANYLNQFSDTPNRSVFTDPAELRTSPLRLPLVPGQTLASLSHLFDLPDHAWDTILSGQADIDNREALADAQTAAATLAISLLGLETTHESDYIALGAKAERYMNSSGWTMAPASSGCGLSNLDLQALVAYTPSFTDFLLNPFEPCKFVQNCGQCGISIFRFIPKGYQCPCCRGIYLGC